MRNTSIFLEVDDMTYNLVVAPHKKNKTFSKLVGALLRSYMEDQYVRAAAEGTLDDLKRQSMESLDSAVMGLNQSLSSMGLFTDELEMTTKKGTKFFSGKVKEHTSGEGGGSEASGEKPTGVDPETLKKFEKENKELREEVNTLREGMSSVTRQNEDIIGMLRKLMESGVSAVSGESREPAKEAIKEEVKVAEKEAAVTSEKVVAMPKEPARDAEEETPSQSDMAKMSAFMFGNFKSF